MLGELLAIVAPVYICAGLGYGWVKSGRPFDTAMVTDLIVNVGAPCLVFSSLVGLDVETSAMLEILGATLVALVAFGVLGTLVLRATGLPTSTYLGPLMYMNAGNMGLPVCFFAFGEAGLALGVVFFATVTIVHFTFGQWIWSGEARIGFLFRQPLFYAAALSAAVLATGLRPPEWVVDTTQLLGGFTIPLMQLTLGASLAELRAGGIPRGVAFSVLRIAMGVVVGAAVAELFGLTGVARGVVILDCAMPVAVFNYMMAERYGRDPSEVASMVMLSTLLSFATVPVLLAWLL